MIKGIDVSEHQGTINWQKVSEDGVSFVIIRAGYGTHYDAQVEYNVEQCEKYKIPYGFYWFSYALDEEDAQNEALKLVELANRCHPTYPLYFDYEYDSDSYYKNNYHVSTPNSALRLMATAFCSTIEDCGYYAGIYANQDYKLNHYGEEIFSRYDIWYCDIDGDIIPDVNLWQFSWEGNVEGIDTDVDLCIDNIDFPKLLTENNLLGHAKEPYEIRKENETNLAIAKQVIRGKWGNGDDRKERLTKAGFDYDVIQDIVNELMGR